LTLAQVYYKPQMGDTIESNIFNSMGKQHKLYLVNKGELFEPFSATERLI
jgi:hypothetical protein